MLHMHCCCVLDTLRVLNCCGCTGSTATYTIIMLCTAMGTDAYIICCALPHVCAMGTATYIVCCVLPHVCAMGTVACLCHGHCRLYCMLCTATCLCHRHCTVSVSCLLWQCCLTLYVVHTLPPGFPLWALLLYMEYNVILGTLHMCCHMTHY